MASADAISISMIIIGVPNTAGMVGMTCLTVRSGVTVRVRSALMPALMTSRASIDFFSLRHSGARAKRANPESITTIRSMDSGPAPSGASWNDDVDDVSSALLVLHRLALD